MSDFVSKQSVEVLFDGERAYNETIYEIHLTCTAGSSAGYFNPMSGHGEPPYGAEFEVDSIQLPAPRVNYKGEVLEQDTLTLTYFQFCAVVGKEVADAMINDAYHEADESGEF